MFGFANTTIESTMKSFKRAGGYNLKGKKTQLLRCKCCEVRNLKDHYFKRLAIKEMKSDQRNTYSMLSH